jgi:hypothetical protein
VAARARCSLLRPAGSELTAPGQPDGHKQALELGRSGPASPLPHPTTTLHTRARRIEPLPTDPECARQHEHGRREESDERYQRAREPRIQQRRSTTKASYWSGSGERAAEGSEALLPDLPAGRIGIGRHHTLPPPPSRSRERSRRWRQQQQQQQTGRTAALGDYS